MFAEWHFWGPILEYGKPFEVESSRDLVLESSQRLGRPLLLGAGKSRALKTGNALRVLCTFRTIPSSP